MVVPFQRHGNGSVVPPPQRQWQPVMESAACAAPSTGPARVPLTGTGAPVKWWGVRAKAPIGCAAKKLRHSTFWDSPPRFGPGTLFLLLSSSSHCFSIQIWIDQHSLPFDAHWFLLVFASHRKLVKLDSFLHACAASIGRHGRNGCGVSELWCPGLL